MTFDVRDLEADKALDMARLYGQCFDNVWEASFFESKLTDSCFAKGIFVKEELVGFILVQNIEDEAEILTFCVRENHRKQGIGESLLLDVLKQSKILSCFLEVRCNNKPAIALYERLGFKKKGVRKGYYQSQRQGSQNSTPDAIIYTYSKN
ncbi:MAG: ribosomal protein S18-alanine N-acetyltransferase [Alphaproteobacteria bacterium]|nr:ribosomal protein S18-alanine N-acetyltransferase [Alphaproteobacteria bacterium]NCQ67209.1 ribosomal protein S18-alanine N-acetyltransferase [Alphaproteobacteria bacterium]NCT07053.1 ribosomal protein S18-alanine N-acetyltransferase [Alphaproteobacteria bacterium]